MWSEPKSAISVLLAKSKAEHKRDACATERKRDAYATLALAGCAEARSSKKHAENRPNLLSLLGERLI